MATAKKSKNSFRGRTGDDARKRTSEKSRYGYLEIPKGFSIFKEEASDKPVFLDFVPYRVTEPHHPAEEQITPERLWYHRRFKMHRYIGSENEAVVCLSSIRKKCPICLAYAELMRAGTDKDKEAAKQIKMKERMLYFVIPRKHKDYEEVPHIWDISYYNFTELLLDELKTDENYEGFPSLENGMTLRIRFGEKSIGKGQPFPQATRVDFKDRDDIDDSILDDLPDMLSLLEILPYKELEAKFLEIDDDDDTGAEAEDMPKQPEEYGRPESMPEETPKDKKEEEPTTDSNECIACEGTGENSKGNECRICHGTGENPEKQEEEDARKQARRNEKKKNDNGPNCPHGHQFGVDTDEYEDDCNNCAEWDPCFDKKEG